MATNWGTPEGHLQVGVDAWCNNPGPGDTFVTVQLRVYARIPAGDSFNFNDSQRIVVTGNSGTNHVWSNTLSGAGAIRLLHSASVNMGIDSDGGPTHVWTATNSEMYNGGTPSASKSLTLPARVGSAPAAPNMPNVGSLTQTSATFSWSAPSNGGSAITHYHLHVATDAAFGNLAWQNSPSLTSQPVTGLQADTTYYARVRAVNAVGTGPWSATRQFTTLSESPAPPGDPDPPQAPVAGSAFSLVPAMRTAAVVELGDVGTYSRPELEAALHDAQRNVRFRYQLLSKDNESKGFVDCILSGGAVQYNFLADIKRTANLSLGEFGDFDVIDFVSDRIRVHYQVRMPDGLWSTWSVGTFVFNAPKREIRGSVVKREVRCFDLSYVLQQGKNRFRYKVASGSNVVEKVREIIDSHPSTLPHEIADSDQALESDVSWEPGTSALKIINDLLDAINYRSLYTDGDGVLRSEEYAVPQDRDAEITYDATDPNLSILGDESALTLDLFDVPNRWALTVSQPDRAPLTAIYENNSVDSPTSIPNRGYVIADIRTDADEQTPTQETLDAKVRRIAHEASQVYEEFEFKTLVNPYHGENSIVEIIYPDAGINHRYSETQWTLPLEAGQYMTHVARRVVNLEEE